MHRAIRVDAPDGAVQRPAIVLFGFSVTLCLLRLADVAGAEWFSSIWRLLFLRAAVGYAGGGDPPAIALAARRATESITVEHYHDLGKLLLAFLDLLGYIAFSQYMLIWYANIPEETTWYLARQTRGLSWASLALLLGIS